MALRDWAQKVLAKEAGEESSKATLIRLMSDGNVWDTWSAPFPDIETFVTEAEAMKTVIADECPIRRVPLMFSAETASGTVLSQFPTSVQGKNRQADALAGAGNGAAKAFAEAMEGISRVVVATLKSAEVQIATVTKTLESQATQIHDLIEYHRAKQEVDLMDAKTDNSTQELVLAQVKEVLPLIPEALKYWVEDREKSSAAAAAAVRAATTTTTTTNGAS